MPHSLYERMKRPSRRGLEKFLGELELAVMEVVWKHQPVSVSDVLTLLKQKKNNLAYTTVMTVMRRLSEKGWLKAAKRGRAYLYQAAHSREETEAVAVGQVVRALLHDFGDVAVAQFVKELDEIDPDQLTRLAELAREVEPSEDEQG